MANKKFLINIVPKAARIVKLEQTAVGTEYSFASKGAESNLLAVKEYFPRLANNDHLTNVNDDELFLKRLGKAYEHILLVENTVATPKTFKINGVEYQVKQGLHYVNITDVGLVGVDPLIEGAAPELKFYFITR